MRQRSEMEVADKVRDSYSEYYTYVSGDQREIVTSSAKKAHAEPAHPTGISTIRREKRIAATCVRERIANANCTGATFAVLSPTTISKSTVREAASRAVPSQRSDASRGHTHAETFAWTKKPKIRTRAEEEAAVAYCS